MKPVAEAQLVRMLRSADRVHAQFQIRIRTGNRSATGAAMLRTDAQFTESGFRFASVPDIDQLIDRLKPRTIDDVKAALAAMVGACLAELRGELRKRAEAGSRGDARVAS